MKRFGLLAVAALCAGGVLHAAPGSQPSSGASLEGSKWSVKVTPDEAAAKLGEHEFDDTLVFEHQKVTMTACAKFGFGGSSYITAKAEDHLALTTEQTSDKQGKTEWTAEIKGASIKGTMKWLKKDGTILHYAFMGKKSS